MTVATIPTKGWNSYETAVRAIGERRGDDFTSDLVFLRALGFVETADPPRLTASGRQFFEAHFLRNDAAEAGHVLQQAVLGLPPVAAVAQLLAGVSGATKATVETVVRSQGFGDGLRDRHVGFLLMLMHRAGVVEYDRTRGDVRVLVRPAHQDEVPASVFVSPGTPFGNRVWLRRILSEGTGELSWLDKHFTSAAFESLWEAIDGNRVSRVRILSLYLSDAHGGRRVKRDFTNLRTELAGRGVELEWRVIDSQLIRDTHDRWIISDGSARNVPNVNAIMSGQHSELNASEQCEELTALFAGYWDSARPIEEFWG